MLPMTKRFNGLAILIAVVLGVSLPAAADAFPFRHSPNASRAQSQYFEEVKEARSQFMSQLDEAGKRFNLAAEREIQRYASGMNRDVRDLTRAGEVKAAYAVRAMAKSTEEWVVSPPDYNGVHFLNTIDLSVKENDAATSKGMDLLVDVEKLGVLYGKQVDVAFESYVEQVAKSRTALIESLQRLLDAEQSAGRINAVGELTTAIEKFKALPQPQRPDAPIEAQADPRDRQAKADAPQGSNDEPHKPSRPTIFEGIHEDPGPQSTTPAPLNKDGDVPWAGYYLLKYSRGGQQGIEFMVKLDEKGGTVLFITRQGPGNERVDLSIPVQVVSHDQSQLIISHKSDLHGETHFHEITLLNGKPTSCKAWWTQQSYTSSEAPIQTGSVLTMGSPEADLLGLADGVYLVKAQQRVNKANRSEEKTIQFEITVDAGHVMVSRHNWGKNDRNWSEFHAFMLNVQTDGNQLVMTYDRDAFDWPDTFVIDMSDKTRPVLKHWWRDDWRPRGDAPSSTGEMVKQ